MLAPGAYLITFTGAQAGVHAHVKRRLEVGHHDTSEKFEIGFVTAAPGKHLELPGGRGTAHKLAFEAGARTVTVGDNHGTHTAKVKVVAGSTVVAN